MQCIYPNCDRQAQQNYDNTTRWCHEHFGYYPHKCVTEGCDRTVQYDDEPWCFTHSPDSGSSLRGYSAHREATHV